MEEHNSDIFQIYLIISVAVVAMLMMAGSIVLFVLYYQKRMVQEQYKLQQLELDYQRRMMEAAIESQENERRRVAGDLHDSIGAMLSTVRVSLITLARRHKETEGTVAESKKMLDETIESVRRISRDLMPSTLEKFGLAQAVKELCERFETTASLPVTFEELGETPSFQKSRELMIFRMIQELLNNALKHSGGSFIRVAFTNENELTISVQDNGKGFNADPNLQRSGLGLFNIENRARLAGANVVFNSAPGEGSTIIITIPYEKV